MIADDHALNLFKVTNKGCEDLEGNLGKWESKSYIKF